MGIVGAVLRGMGASPMGLKDSVIAPSKDQAQRELESLNSDAEQIIAKLREAMAAKKSAPPDLLTQFQDARLKREELLLQYREQFGRPSDMAGFIDPMQAFRDEILLQCQGLRRDYARWEGRRGPAEKAQGTGTQSEIDSPQRRIWEYYRWLSTYPGGAPFDPPECQQSSASPNMCSHCGAPLEREILCLQCGQAQHRVVDWQEALRAAVMLLNGPAAEAACDLDYFVYDGTLPRALADAVAALAKTTSGDELSSCVTELAQVNAHEISDRGVQSRYCLLLVLIGLRLEAAGRMSQAADCMKAAIMALYAVPGSVSAELTEVKQAVIRKLSSLRSA